MKKEIVVDGLSMPTWIYRTRPQAFNSWDKLKKAEYIETRKQKNRDNVNRYAQENPEKHLISKRKNNQRYFLKNADLIREKKRTHAYKKYYENLEEMRKRARDFMKKKRSQDNGFKIKQNISRRIRHLLTKSNSIKKDSTIEYVGCTTEELKEYIESLMTNKMKWDNYGKIWEIDHIMPCSSIDHTDQQQVKRCWHYTNLRPITIYQNRSKHAKITDPQYKLLIPIK